MEKLGLEVWLSSRVLAQHVEGPGFYPQLLKKR
jgi:hypothetical protein